VRLLDRSRVVALHQALAASLGDSAALDLPRLEAALACAYDASALDSSDCRAQATLVLLGFREHRPAGLLDPPLAFLCVLALLDANSYALEDIRYAEVTGKLDGLLELRPEQGETEALHHWLVRSTRSSSPGTAPLPKSELVRLLEAAGLKVELAEGQVRVLKRKLLHETGSWLPNTLRRQTWEPIHTLPDPGEGLIGLAALRELRRACELEAGPFSDDRAWQEGTLQLHRHLWPRLKGLWQD
jgi:hypothetical protein